MVLKNIKLVERQKLTSGYPVLIASTSGSGKTTAVANLSDEEKSRTSIKNFDNKPISDDDTMFAKVFTPNKSYLEDDEIVEKIIKGIEADARNENIDRIIVDTSTELLKFLELWGNTNFSGFDSWKAYNDAITSIFAALKSASMDYGKFVYVFGHYPPAVKGQNSLKRFLTTKGNEHKNVLEEKFTTVVEAILENRQFKFYADSFEEKDTTKTKLTEGGFKFVRTSLDDLEQVLTKTRKLEAHELIDV